MARKSSMSQVENVSNIADDTHRGAFLTPKEMNDLTEAWKPYRSLGMSLQ